MHLLATRASGELSELMAGIQPVNSNAKLLTIMYSENDNQRDGSLFRNLNPGGVFRNYLTNSAKLFP